jgi:4-amino-4-deoxy-L-arabinose transferase-like glycosyltransferase
VYTRGLVNAYVMAPSLAVFGTHDFGARLPSALASALLIPLVFWFGRSVGGSAVGLLAAAPLVPLQPLVDWAHSAWLPSIFLLLLTLATYWCWLGLARGVGWAQVAGAGAFLLALLSSEFALHLPGACAVCLAGLWLSGDRRLLQRRASGVALGLLVAGLVGFVALALALRVGTLAGAGSEISQYFTPGLSLGPPRYYFDRLLSGLWPLLLVAIVGFPFAVRREPGAALLLGGLALLAYLAPSFVMQGKLEQRYAIAVLPPLALLGAWGSWLLAWRLGRSTLLAGLLTLGVVLVSVADDARAAGRDLASPPPSATWLQTVERLGIQPSDVILGEAPTILQLYLGRDEYYVHPEGYERYTYQANDAVRNIYTDAIVLRRRDDFERLVQAGRDGTVVWVIGREERLSRLSAQIDSDLWRRMLQQADVRQTTRDRWLILRLRLPVL